MDALTSPGMVYGVVALALVLALALLMRALRGKWDLVGAHFSDHTRHLVAFALLIGTSVGSLWFFSGGRLTLGGLQEIALNAGGITVACEVGALIAASYVARIDRLLLNAKGKVAQYWKSYRRKVLVWFYIVAGCSATANIAFRIVEYGATRPEAYVQAAFSGLVPIVLVNLLLIVLRPLPIDIEQRGRDKAKRALGNIVEAAGNVVQGELHALARGEQFSADRLGVLITAWTFFQPFAGDDAREINQALRLYAPAQPGALPDGGRYFDKGEVMQLYGVPERTAQDWIGKCAGARKRAGSRRMEAPASALYEAYGVPTGSLSPETKPPRNRAGSRENAQDRADEVREDATEAQEHAEEVPAIVYDAQPVAG